MRLSVYAMIGGALVAASGDLAFNVAGYAFILLNDAFTAANGVYLKKKLDARQLGNNGLLFYNSLFSMPLAVVITALTGDLGKVSTTSVLCPLPSLFETVSLIHYPSLIRLTFSLRLSSCYHVNLENLEKSRIQSQLCLVLVSFDVRYRSVCNPRRFLQICPRFGRAIVVAPPQARGAVAGCGPTFDFVGGGGRWTGVAL